MRFDLVVEDQSVGLKRMKQGDVMACICASPQPVNGGAVMALGALRYRAVASPAFIQRYQLHQQFEKRISQAPCLVFNQDDQLQHQYLQHVAQAVPQRFHLCPSSEGFLKATLAGLGFGLLPELQMQSQLESGELVDLTPGYSLDTELYWHYWQSESPLMYQLRQNVLQVAGRFLSGSE